MATLLFLKNGEELLRYHIQKQEVTVGRSSKNDVCLPDNNISRVHLLIEKQGNSFVLADRSTNGTTVNGEKVLSRKLQDQDKIGLGKWEILFDLKSASESEESTAKIDTAPTQIISYSPESGELQSRRAALQKKGTKKEIILTRRIFTIGKNKTNTLTIKEDDFVSSFHCKIEAKRGEFYIKDLNSTNGTFLNNQRVIESSLPDNCSLRIGQTEYKFFYKTESSKIKADSKDTFYSITSKNKKMREIFTLIRKVAPSDATTLLLGESGTGKELFARALHSLSSRCDGRFVPINCAAIGRDLIESELFGHEKGAFTSAHTQRQGAFEYANDGTLFLDEIAEIPLDLQATLLRAIESREIKHVGGNQLIDVDIRLIAATNADLAKLVKEKKFRQDLFYRLFVIPIYVPPLRQRIEDIPLLVEQFLLDKTKQGKTIKIEEAALNALIDHTWEGNVRELRNVIERAALVCEGGKIKIADLNFAPQGLAEETQFDYSDSETVKYAAGKSLTELEREKIVIELNKHKYNVTKAAKALGLAKSTLHSKMKKYEIEKSKK